MHGTRVWRRFQRVISGQMVNFKIQEMPTSMNEEALRMMKKHFFVNEPYSEASRIQENKEDMMHMYNLWRNYAIPQKLAVVCLKDEETNLSPEIIGINFLTLSVKENRKFHLPDKPEKFMKIYNYIEAQYNIFDMYNVDKYLSAFGLCVNDAYRSCGVATEILSSRNEICKALGISMTCTQFSTPQSQKSAENAGFKTIKEVKFSEIENALNLKFPEGCDVSKVMTKVIQ